MFKFVLILTFLISLLGCIQGPAGKDGVNGVDGKTGKERDSIIIDLKMYWYYVQLRNKENYLIRYDSTNLVSDTMKNNFEIIESEKSLYEKWDTSIVTVDSLRSEVSGGVANYSTSYFLKTKYNPNGWWAVFESEKYFRCIDMETPPNQWLAVFTNAIYMPSTQDSIINKRYCVDRSAFFDPQKTYYTLNYYPGKGFQFNYMSSIFHTGTIKVYYW